LYDLRKDPDQHTNVAPMPSYAKELERLRSTLGDWQRSTGDPRITNDDDRWDRTPYYGPAVKAEPR
jgi:N-sulfoglucosamine sulfohydrolase